MENGRDKKSKTEGPAKAALGVVMGAAPGLAFGKPAEAAFGAVLGLAGAGVGALIEAVAEQRRRRVEALLAEFVLDAATPTEAGERVRAAIANPDVGPAVIEAAKAMDAIVDERVIPAIAALTRAYAAGEKPVDAFFRGTLRLLSESTPEELARVAAFAAITEQFPGTDPEVIFMPRYNRDPSQPEYQVSEPDHYGQAQFFRVPGGIEVPGVLAHHRLARARSTDERGRATVVVRRSDARALRSYIEAAHIAPAPSEQFT